MNEQNYRTKNGAKTILASRGAIINVWRETTCTLNGVAVILQPRVDYRTVKRINTYIIDDTEHPNGVTTDYIGNVRFEASVL